MPSAIIVEDEILAAERLRVLLDECGVVLLKTFAHAQPALEWLSVHETDIVFTDINMPEINGLDFVKRIKRIAKKQPHVIFTTAYEEHALRAFELAAEDYLLKPIKIARLQAALARVQSNIEESEDEFKNFQVFNRERMVEIPWQQARYLQADQKTVFLITGDGSRYELPNKTLVHWEELLGDKVIRVHRNALVMRHTLDSLIRLDDDEDEGSASWGAKVLDVEEILPVSRRQLSAIRRLLRDGGV